MITIQIIHIPGVLIGGQWHDAGAIVAVPEDRARRLIHAGHALAFSPAGIVPVRLGDDAIETATAPPAREHAARRIRK